MDWTILFSVLGGAVGASIITSIVNWQMKLREERHEHNKWLRDKKFSVYTEAIVIYRKSNKDHFKLRSSVYFPEFADALHHALTQVHLIAPDKIRKLAEETSRAVDTDIFQAKIQELNKAMNADLKASSHSSINSKDPTKSI